MNTQDLTLRHLYQLLNDSQPIQDTEKLCLALAELVSDRDGLERCYQDLSAKLAKLTQDHAVLQERFNVVAVKLAQGVPHALS